MCFAAVFCSEESDCSGEVTSCCRTSGTYTYHVSNQCQLCFGELVYVRAQSILYRERHMCCAVLQSMGGCRKYQRIDSQLYHCMRSMLLRERVLI